MDFDIHKPSGLVKLFRLLQACNQVITHLCLCACNKILQLDDLVVDAEAIAFLDGIVGCPLLPLALQLGGGAQPVDGHLVSVHNLHRDAGGQDGVAVGHQSLHGAGGYAGECGRGVRRGDGGGIGQGHGGGVRGYGGLVAASDLDHLRLQQQLQHDRERYTENSKNREEQFCFLRPYWDLELSIHKEPLGTPPQLSEVAPILAKTAKLIKIHSAKY